MFISLLINYMRRNLFRSLLVSYWKLNNVNDTLMRCE